jgi:hypothetical protein
MTNIFNCRFDIYALYELEDTVLQTFQTEREDLDLFTSILTH